MTERPDDVHEQEDRLSEAVERRQTARAATGFERLGEIAKRLIAEAKARRK